MSREDFRTERAAILERSDLTGEALRTELTTCVDNWLTDLFEKATDGDADGLALVAVGGYGRREPSPYSDLDLVLVHRDDCKADKVAEVADRIWYPVWDSGLSLDHSVRTVADAVSVAGADLRAALGLLDVRPVVGDETLSAQLRERTLASWRAAAARRLPELMASTRERADRFGEASFLLEPDLKEARGGLRDHHALRAVAATWVVDAPSYATSSAYRLLLDVRGELHRCTGRSSDKLLLQEQDGVASALGYADADALLANVYRAARSIAFAVDAAFRRVDAWLPSRTTRRWLPGRRRPGTVERRPLADGVVEQGGEVVLARDADPVGDPALLLRFAATAAEHELPMAPHALERLAAESAPVAEPWPPGVRNAFLALLGAGRGTVAVMEALDQLGLVARLLPEWEHVRFLPQRNPVHMFTVDRHLVEATVAAATLARTVSRPDLLLLGALFHDIGKGMPGDHTDAGVALTSVITPRLGLPPDDCAVVVSLVRNHLLLPDTATRRDLDDPKTARDVADAVGGSRTTLELLHALTQADARATGPAAWSDWKAGLVGDLVSRTRAVLEGEPHTNGTTLTAEQQAFAERGELAVVGQQTPDGSYAVWVTAPDRPGLMWRAAGVLALHRLDVLAATATSSGPTAVTLFTVAPRFGSAPDWRLVRDDLHAALDGSLPLQERLAAREQAYAAHKLATAPPRVLVLDDAAESATVVEVRAHDAVGLLHRIGRALDGCGLDIRSARVSTFGAEVVDAFYVVNAGGRKITDRREQEAVEAAVLAALQ
ncbi:MAG: [protein-PII] uridylyltransferase [Actinomycetes bacterium]